MGGVTAERITSRARFLLSLQSTAGNRAAARVAQRWHKGSDEEDASPGGFVVQRMSLSVFEKQQVKPLLEQRAAEWPASADEMIAWAKSWNQVVVFINQYTQAEWNSIRDLFPTGIDNVKKAAIDKKVADERIRLDLLTPLTGRILKASAIARSTRLILGSNLKNPDVIAILSAIDPVVAHWNKYTTPMYSGGTGNPNDDYSVHYYRNWVTHQVCTTRDYKKVFRDNSSQII